MFALKTLKRTLGENPVLMYLILFFLVMVGTYYLFSCYGLFDTNEESARYMLSTLVQSEAAIIAIVVTLSLVAVQLTASSYSPKVTEIFRKSPHLWVLMFSYIVSMIYSIIILKMIGEFPTERAQQSHVNNACFLGIFCFATLPFYTYKILDMLRPSIIIAELAQGITKDSFLTKEKPFRSVSEIIIDSVKKDDHETVRSASNKLGNKICHTLKNNPFGESEQRTVREKILDEFKEITLLLTLKEAYAAQTIKMITDICLVAIEKELEIVADTLVLLLEYNTRNITKGRFIWEAVKVEISELKAIAEAAINKEFLDIVEKVILVLRKIAIFSLERYDKTGNKEDKRREINAATEARNILNEFTTLTNNKKISCFAKRYLDEIKSEIEKRSGK